MQEHQPMEAVHADDREWETLRWPGQWSKMLFHPRADRPTEPNAGLVRYEPGSHHPFHKHDFAQVWYILEGEFRIGDAVYTPDLQEAVKRFQRRHGLTDDAMVTPAVTAEMPFFGATV